MDDESDVVEVLKKLEPYFSEQEKRIDELEKRVDELEKKAKR